MPKKMLHIWALAGAIGGVLAVPAFAQTPAKSQAGPGQVQARPTSVASPPAATTLPSYVIGADDLLSIRFWGDQQLSADVVVRPDGKISLSLLNDVQAAGMTPEQLARSLEKAASKFVTEPEASVIVREVRSRKVYVLGQGIAKSGSILLNGEMNVLQVISAAGGLLEWAKKGDIVVIRKDQTGKERRFKFNYNEVVKGEKIQQNITLQPDDTVIVP